MSENDELSSKIANILNQTQHTTAIHQKSLILLKQIYNKTTSQDFYTVFERYIKVLLCTQQKPVNQKAERCIAFFVDFFISVASVNKNDDIFEESEFFKNVCNFLLQNLNVTKEVIRYRACQILQMLFEKLLHVELDNDLCSKIEEAMLECIEDEKYMVRVTAVHVLKHFQNPRIQDDIIGNALKSHMISDPSPYVRKACVEAIAPKRDVIPLLVLKTRDVDVNVRLSAFKKVTNYPRHFKIKEKQMIIDIGLNDDSALIIKYFEKTLVIKWLENYDDNYLNLIQSLKLISSENYLKTTTYIIKSILKILFRNKTITELVEVLEYEDNRIITNLYNWERLIYWSSLIEYMKESGINNVEEYIIPDAVNLCDKIKSYVEEQSVNETNWNEFQTILIQVFNVLHNCDFSDPYAERTLKELIVYCLKKHKVDQNVITNMFQCLEKCVTNVMDYSYFVNEIMSSILYDETKRIDVQDSTRLDIQQQKSELLELKHTLDQNVEDKDFENAKRLQLEMEIISSTIEKLEGELTVAEDDLPDLLDLDVDALQKALNVLIVHLQSHKVDQYSTILATIKSEIINELLSHKNLTILALTMKCYALLGILSRDVAAESITILSLPLTTKNYGNVELLKTSIAGVVDLLLAHGTHLVASPYEDGLTESFNEEDLSTFMGCSSLTQIVQALINLTDQQDIEIYAAAIRALVLLVANKVVWSSSVLTRLILRWCVPTGCDDDDDDDYYQISQQFLGYLISELSVIYDDATCVQNAVIPIINTILDATRDSALRDIQGDNVVSLLINLLGTFKNGYIAHINLAYQLLHKINNDISDNKKNLVYAKMLLMLNLFAISKSAINELIALCDMIREELSNANIKSYIIKFITKLNLIEFNDEGNILNEI